MIWLLVENETVEWCGFKNRDRLDCSQGERVQMNLRDGRPVGDDERMTESTAAVVNMFMIGISFFAAVKKRKHTVSHSRLFSRSRLYLPNREYMSSSRKLHVR